jgi:hypothetical protein
MLLMTAPSTEVLDNKICNMEKQLNRIEEKLDTFISTAEDKFARKDSVKKLWTIVWSIIGFFFVALGTTIVAIVKYFLSLNI